MIDQIVIAVSDLAVSREFYAQVLAPLQYQVVSQDAEGCGFSIMQRPDFWIRQGGPVAPPVRIAFTCRDRASVDGFYAAATSAGADSQAQPDVREESHGNSYAATILDPDGNTIEAVCHRPQ
jgi:predicted lactoylglutathione lyase